MTEYLRKRWRKLVCGGDNMIHPEEEQNDSVVQRATDETNENENDGAAIVLPESEPAKPTPTSTSAVINVTAGTSTTKTVSYTHLTLPTNREV